MIVKCSSLQDTAVGVSALAALSALLSASADSAGGQLTVRVVYGGRGHRYFKLWHTGQKL